MIDWDEIARRHKARKYQVLAGVSFLKAYFKDHGITDREIDLCERWGWGVSNSNLIPNDEGMKYAQKRTESIKAYRSITLEQIEKNIGHYPWEWPTAMSFQKIVAARCIPKSNEDVYGVYTCVYNGREYYFGVGREEVPITEDMRQNGVWYVYRWSD